MGLVSRLSLANHSNPRVLPGGACLVQPRRMAVRILSHGWTRSVIFDLSETLPVGGGLLVPCSLPGTLVIKQLMQMITVVSDQVGGFNQCASPNRTILIISRYIKLEYEMATHSIILS